MTRPPSRRGAVHGIRGITGAVSGSPVLRQTLREAGFVIPLRPGDSEKLNSRGGCGGYEEDGTAFFAWHFDWPGGDGAHVIYFEGERSIVDREWVAVSPAQ